MYGTVVPNLFVRKENGRISLTHDREIRDLFTVKRGGTARSGALVILTCQFGPPPAAPRALRTAAREALIGGLDKDNRKSTSYHISLKLVSGVLADLPSG